jgi:hypothetical protein
MQQSRDDRHSHLTQILGTPAGRLYVISEYKRAAGMAPNAMPPVAVSFTAMIEQILSREFPA